MLGFAASARANPVEFNLPAGPADRALLAFARQAAVQILFSSDQLSRVRSHAVVGRYEPQTALDLLLRGTGFQAQRTGEAKWIVAPTGPPVGTIKGRILAPDGFPARRVRVSAFPGGTATTTDADGAFELNDLRPGSYTVQATAPAYRPVQIIDVTVSANVVTRLTPETLHAADDPTRLEPFIVKARTNRVSPLDHSDALYGTRTAGGNLDLSRTETDVLPYMIFNRRQIARSGVVNLNEFLERELIDSSAGVLPPEQNGQAESYQAGSDNLSLRGFKDEETVILVNGRPLPEVMTSGVSEFQPPDVNFIPLSLVQQVEVLPVSAAALYTGNAVGGVINIVLRPDVDANVTEITATYTNAVRGFDAPQSSLSLLHAQALLGGALRVRLNASFTRTVPATEAELGYRQRRAALTTAPDAPLYRATPNVRSISAPDLLPAGGFAGAAPLSSAPAIPAAPPLFGPGTPSVTSVAPGADGGGGLAAFSGREGVRQTAFFDSPGRFSTGLDSLDFPYGREQQRSTYYGSFVYDVLPRLQLALDGTYARTVVHRGYDVFPQELTLKATSPFNPFHQDVLVDLNETAPLLGQNYDEARLEFSSLVLSALIKLRDEWRIALDSQYAHNLVKYRGLSGANSDRWQQLVDSGGYNPLRDTQVYGPPPAFYDQVLVYRAGRGQFATLGNYDTLDLAARVMNESLALPTGKGVLNVGGDYRKNHLARYTDERRFSDGTLAQDPVSWQGRTLVRYSAFGELQGPLVPKARLPHGIQELNTDLALRYVASNNARESNFAPTYGAKIRFAGGLMLRGSITTSTRFPTPHMSRPLVLPGDNGNGGAMREEIFDPIRNERYGVIVNEVVNPDLQPESAVTQTGGIVFERGRTQQFRAAIDFVDTRKVNELVFLDKDTVVAKEALWPERVQRAPAGPGDPVGGGLIQSVVTSTANLAGRHSQDWTASIDYRWNGFRGGTLEAYARALYFERYRVRALPHTPAVDELNAPDGVVPLLKYRANFGASWSNDAYGFGADGHYFHSRLLPRAEWEIQGSDRIKPFWQFDVFADTDIARWLPWNVARYGLRLQVRVNNVLNASFPKYVNDAYGTGVQPYGDWRGRVYSVSLTATF